MNFPPTITVAVSSLLIAGVFGCSDWSAETAGRKIDKATARAGEKMEQAAADVKQKTVEKMEQAAADVRQKTVTAEKAAEKAVADAAITAKIKAAMIAEPGLKALQIDVDTTNGVVVLNGTVDSPQNKDRAQALAQAVEGVKSVENRLMLKSTG